MKFWALLPIFSFLLTNCSMRSGGTTCVLLGSHLKGFLLFSPLLELWDAYIDTMENKETQNQKDKIKVGLGDPKFRFSQYFWRDSKKDIDKPLFFRHLPLFLSSDIKMNQKRCFYLSSDHWKSRFVSTSKSPHRESLVRHWLLQQRITTAAKLRNPEHLRNCGNMNATLSWHKLNCATLCVL